MCANAEECAGRFDCLAGFVRACDERKQCVCNQTPPPPPTMTEPTTTQVAEAQAKPTSTLHLHDHAESLDFPVMMELNLNRGGRWWNDNRTQTWGEQHIIAAPDRSGLAAPVREADGEATARA